MKTKLLTIISLILITTLFLGISQAKADHSLEGEELVRFMENSPDSKNIYEYICYEINIDKDKQKNIICITQSFESDFTSPAEILRSIIRPDECRGIEQKTSSGYTFLVAVRIAGGKAFDPKHKLNNVGDNSTNKKSRVLDLQRALKLMGYSPGAVDGIWGPNTKRALIKYQKKVKLEANGIANYYVWDRIIRD